MNGTPGIPPFSKSNKASFPQNVVSIAAGCNRNLFPVYGIVIIARVEGYVSSALESTLRQGHFWAEYIHPIQVNTGGTASTLGSTILHSLISIHSKKFGGALAYHRKDCFRSDSDCWKKQLHREKIMEKFVFLSTLVLLCTKMFSTKEIELDMSRPNVDTMTNIRKEAYDIKPRTSFIHEVVKGIHANQHPPKDKCKHTRLLMLAYANNLEGVGSILRDVTVGLVSLLCWEKRI